MPVPKISICMPSYNQASFLGFALNSILKQSFQDFEIIFVDDGSTDCTLDVVRKSAAEHPSVVRVFRHPDECNHGISATSNLAIQNASGKYLVIMDSDDLWYPDTLEKRVMFMASHSDADLMCSHYDIINEAGAYIRRKAAPDITQDAVSLRTMTHAMIMGCVIGNPTVMLRRSCLAEMDWFDDRLVNGDWELWTRLVANHKVVFLPESLVMHRRHEQNITGHHSMETELKRRIDVMLALEKKAVATGGALALPRLRALINLELCSYYFCIYRRKEAFENLKKAFETDKTLLADGAVYFNAWLLERPQVPQPRADFHAWIGALLKM